MPSVASGWGESGLSMAIDGPVSGIYTVFQRRMLPSFAGTAGSRSTILTLGSDAGITTGRHFQTTSAPVYHILEMAFVIHQPAS